MQISANLCVIICFINSIFQVPTLGSQEGAFENVRMNYSGEQGQTIRQLMSAHMIRRVAMCCLASPHGKRQHLGKFTINVSQVFFLLFTDILAFYF